MSYTPKILIVDDEPSVRKLMKKYLSGLGYEIKMGANGLQTIEIVDKDIIDLILLDIGLPDMGGHEVLEYIRRMSPETQVIMITGDASPESAVEAMRRGAYDYLRKPFQRLELLKTIKNALDHKKEQKERKEAEKKLQASEEKFRTLVSNIPGAVYRCTLGADRTMYYISDAIEKICGYPASDFVENSVRPYASIVHPNDREMVEKSVYGGSDQRKPFITEYRIFHANGTVRWVYDKGQAVFGNGEKALWVDGAILDITRAKELENQIIIKNKMVSLGRVAAGMAHEIRNPLTGINTYLYTLEDLCNLDTPEQKSMEMMRRIVGQIQVASNKIESVIRRVMDFSKPGSPKMILTDINHSVKEAINLSAVTMRKTGIKVGKTLPDGLPKCYADSHLIELVILNLINNAAKAVKKIKGSKIIGVSSFSKNNSVFITVSDSGPGVPKEVREKIFDPFVTTDSDGSGIGLSIAQRIIADHNGSIELGTSKWGGAEFKIELPIEKRMHPR